MLWGDFNGYRIGLVQTLGDLEAVRGQLSSKTLCGIDTETTGLSYISDRVVGVCISCGSSYSKKDYAGFYIPIRHYGYSANLPVEDVISFTQYVVDNFRTAWWNRSFDFSMLELDGFRCPFVGGTHDIQFMAHEMFNEEYPKLKDFSKKLLKFQTILFEDNAAEANNFATTDPEVTFVYAGADALQTALLGIRIWEDYPQVHKIYALDNECGEAVRRMTKTPIRFDFDFLDSEVRRSTQRMLEIEQDIYRMVGYPFNVKSGRECADALSRFVTLTVKTKSGEYKVDKDILHSIDHPLAKLLLEHSAVSTYLSSFVKKMASWRKSGPIRLNYNLVVALTGRMSSSASKGNDYYSPLNAQNIPKIEEKQYLHPHPHIGYCLRPYEEGCVRDDAGKPVRYKTKAGLRHTFMADDGGKEDEWVFVGFDYASEEVALAANWSQDEGLLYPMKHGLDVHMYVAEKMFGVADPAFRSKSKAISFGKLYGGGPSLIASRLGISVDAAKDLIIHYDKTLPKLKHWQEWLKKNARRTGFAQTLFGRHIYVGRWFNSSDSGMRAYAERVSLNAPIQGPAHINTPIHTTIGYVPIGVLYDWHLSGELAERGIKCWNGNRWCDFTVVDAGLRDIYTFKMRRGNRVQCGHGHLWKTWGDSGTEFKDVADFSVGDNIAGSVARLQEYPRMQWKAPTRQFGRGAQVFDATRLTEEQSAGLMYWIGYALGDGSFGAYDSCPDSAQIEYTLGSHELHRYDEAVEFFTSIGINVGKLCFRPHTMKGRKGDAYSFKVSSIMLRDALESVGIDYRWVHHTKRIPWQLMCSSVAERRALVRGFFDSDGCKTLESFMWHMCQDDILLDLQRLLRTLGFDSSVFQCGDGSWMLSVCHTVGFARFFGYDDKGYGKCFHSDKWFDKRKTPEPLLEKFRDWSRQHWWLAITDDLDGKAFNSFEVLRSRVLNGGSVSINTFVDLCRRCCCEHILEGDDFLEAQEIVSIEREAPERCFCLSLEDECHCYESDGLISHNCIPQSTYVVSQDGKTLHPWRDFVGRRVSFVDTRDGSVKQGVPTFRGVYDLHLVVFNTGDFCVCNDLHKFVKYGKEQVLLSLSQLGDSLTPLMPTHRKRWWSTICGLFSRGRETLSGIASRASMGRSFGVSDAGVAWCLFRSWLCGTRYVCRGREESAHALRSLCDLYGYNLVYDFKRSRVGHSVFKLKFGRKRRAFGVLVRPTGTKDNVISPCMCSGLPIYPLMGNVHKNTGGDLIRRDLVMLMKHMERDEEFRRNVEFQFTIHDEIQVRIRLPYLKRGIKVMQAIMSFWPKQFQTPLLTEPCVGFRLGGELDIDAVADDGFIIPKGFTPPQEYLDAHEGWFYIDQWFKVNKERRGITEW